MSDRIVESVNVGRPREVEHGGKPAQTAIWKHPVAGRVAVRGVNIEGDEQADRSVHGGTDKAVYAYSREDYGWWEQELGRTLDPGTFGENLTLRGVDVNGARIGERWRIGGVVLEVSEPRFPCWKIGVRMNDPKFLKRFAQALRTGTYLRIVEEGELAAGDVLTIEHRPDHDVTIELFARAYLRDHSLGPEVVKAPALAPRWRAWFDEHGG
jgi:MOSC domain-containing protein YiiM